VTGATAGTEATPSSFYSEGRDDGGTPGSVATMAIYDFQGV